MSKKGGEILIRLWNNMDQAPMMDKVDEAFKAIPTKLQKKFIEELLDNSHLIDKVTSDLDDEEIAEYRSYVSK